MPKPVKAISTVHVFEFASSDSSAFSGAASVPRINDPGISVPAPAAAIVTNSRRVHFFVFEVSSEIYRLCSSVDSTFM